MSAVSRRALFDVFRKRAEPEERFSLARFYAGRAPTPATLPTFTVHAGDVATETTSVGVPRERVVRIRPDACLAHRSFCTTCSERCPVEGAITIELGRPRIDETRCDGCGICVRVCPAPSDALEVALREAAR